MRLNMIHVDIQRKGLHRSFKNIHLYKRHKLNHINKTIAKGNCNKSNLII